jgi:ammonia channel protein AmtB
MLHLADYFFTLLHLAIIGFNLLGWIWRSTRKAHLILVALTAGSWLILGIWFGFGYCPITDWQWQIKEKLGETHLPYSFNEYYAEKVTGTNFSTSLVDAVTAGSFALACILAVYFRFIHEKLRKKKIRQA